MRVIQSLTGGYKSSARVVDGALILSLPDAISPVVWRMDLDQVKSSALEIREADGKFTLTLKTPRQDAHEIAPFATKHRALKALMAVSRALEQAHGKIRPAANSDTPAPQKGGKVKKSFLVLSLLVIAALLFIVVRQGPAVRSINDIAPAQTALGSGPAKAPAAGVPTSADEFLRNRP